MNTLKDYVDWKLAHADKVAEAEGYPLILEKCKNNKQMKELKVWGADGGVGEKTVNLYDTKTYPATDDQCVWGGNGGLGQKSNMSVTYYIPCSELRGKTITCGLGGGANPGICFYDDNQTYISGGGYRSKSTITITVPDNASYLRWCFNTDAKDQAMIVEGDTLPTYEPYGKYKIPIVQRGKNLLDMMKGYDWSGASKLETYENGHLWKGNISSSTDQYVASAGWVSYNVNYTQKFPIMKGKSITISVDVTPIEKHDETRKTATKFLCLVYKGTTEVKTLISSEIPLEIGVKSHLSYTFMPSNYEGDALKVIVYLCSHTMKIENLQVEYGSTDTPYEPYVEPTTHNVFVDEPLSANDVLDVKEHMELPKLTSKTTVFTTDTTVSPSKMYGKYIKI